MNSVVASLGRAVLFGSCRQVILVRCFSVVGGASSVIRVVVMSCLSCLCVWCRVCLFVRSTFFTLVFALLCCVVGFFVIRARVFSRAWWWWCPSVLFVECWFRACRWCCWLWWHLLTRCCGGCWSFCFRSCVGGGAFWFSAAQNGVFRLSFSVVVRVVRPETLILVSISHFVFLS